MLMQENMDMTRFTILQNTYYTNIKDVYSGKHWATLIMPILLEKRIDYLFHIDADEILFMRNFVSIKDLIAHYQPFDRLHIDWVIFGDHIKTNDSYSIIQPFKKSEEFLRTCNKGIQGKSLVKVASLAISTSDSHICPHLLRIKPESLQKNCFNSVFDVKDTLSIRTVDAPLYLAHYSHQDIDGYISRKICSDLHLEVYYHSFVSNELRKDLLSQLHFYKSDIIESVYNPEYFTDFRKRKEIRDSVDPTFLIIVGAAIHTYQYVTKLLKIENTDVQEFHEKIKNIKKI